MSLDDYFIPELRQELTELPAGSSTQDILDRVNLLSRLLNRLLVDAIGDDGTTPEARTK